LLVFSVIPVSSSLNYDRYIAGDILENDEALDKDMSDSEEKNDE